MGLFNSVKTPDNTTHTVSLPYGYCETAAGTAAKTVTVPNVSELTEGLAIIVRFKNSNSASSPTLNVNGLGAKNIYIYGTTKASTSTTVSGWNAGAVQLFVYNGSGWVRDYWSNTTYTNATLGQGFAICDTEATDAEKVCSISRYALNTGGIVMIQFTHGNTASNPTLNIAEKGAKPILYNNLNLNEIYNFNLYRDMKHIQPGDICTFIYDGSSYHLISNDRWHKDINDLNFVLKNTRNRVYWKYTGQPSVDGGYYKVSDATPSYEELTKLRYYGYNSSTSGIEYLNNWTVVQEDGYCDTMHVWSDTAGGCVRVYYQNNSLGVDPGTYFYNANPTSTYPWTTKVIELSLYNYYGFEPLLKSEVLPLATEKEQGAVTATDKQKLNCLVKESVGKVDTNTGNITNEDEIIVYQSQTSRRVRGYNDDKDVERPVWFNDADADNTYDNIGTNLSFKHQIVYNDGAVNSEMPTGRFLVTATGTADNWDWVGIFKGNYEASDLSGGNVKAEVYVYLDEWYGATDGSGGHGDLHGVEFDLLTTYDGYDGIHNDYWFFPPCIYTVALFSGDSYSNPLEVVHFKVMDAAWSGKGYDNSFSYNPATGFLKVKNGIAAGEGSIASGKNSFAFGYRVQATGNYSHAEGGYIGPESKPTIASGYASHAEGHGTTASGDHGAHSEGFRTIASGNGSHAEGHSAEAIGEYSHAGGYYTKASGQYQTVIGKYNQEDTANTYAFIVGRGRSTNSRANAFTIDWAGNAWFSGGVTANNFNGYTIAKSVPSDAKFTDTTYSAATTSANGLMTAAMVTKLNGIATGANKYSLPAATSSALGGVKIGSNISVSNGTISLTKSNVTSALGYTPTKKEFIFDTYSKSVTINPGDQSVIVGALTQRSGYTLLGYINQNGGYTDQWLISYGTYGGNVVAMVHSKYSGTLTQTISCTAIWYKNQ